MQIQEQQWLASPPPSEEREGASCSPREGGAGSRVEGGDPINARGKGPRQVNYRRSETPEAEAPVQGRPESVHKAPLVHPIDQESA
jgi:hypothetical protein